MRYGHDSAEVGYYGYLDLFIRISRMMPIGGSMMSAEIGRGRRKPSRRRLSSGARRRKQNARRTRSGAKKKKAKRLDEEARRIEQDVLRRSEKVARKENKVKRYFVGKRKQSADRTTSRRSNRRNFASMKKR
jgi:hypothetical protein